jgi:hypothetical protein
MSFKTPDLVTKNASEMVLTSNDFEDGWSLANSEDITALKAGSQSAHEVTFLPQSFTVAMTGVVVEVAVYPSIDLARDAYSKVMPVTLSVEHPSICDECTLYLRNYSTEVTFFREKNVVAWVSSGQFEGGSYAHWSES